ncbi:unnamed protein product [Victoria cruziana]
METVTGDLISKLLDAVASLAQSKWKIIRTAKVELDHLVRKLERIKSCVARAESLPFFKQKEIKSWMIEFKGVLYDADDMLEAYQYRMELLKAKGASSTGRTLRRKKVRMAFTHPSAGFKKHVLYPYKLGHHIKDIDQQLSRLIHDLESEDKLKSLLCGPNQDAADNSSAIADRNTTSALDEKGKVGREGDKEKLIEQLQQQGGGDANSIVAIVGKGGLGKTFLAQMICNDERVREHFADGVWWVCVSEKPNPNDMAKKLLEAIYKKDASDGAKDLETLCSKLRDAIKDKRFLLVLDDVWDLDWWEKLRLHFQGGASGSKFLITSRKKKLMKLLEHHYGVFVHDLRGFTGEESRKLFTKQIGKTEAVLRDEGKLEIGERILKKCGDLPLVIKTVGSLLRTKETAAQWQNVEKSEIWSWKEEDDGEGGVLLPGLVLSYNDLQAHLKNCFVYCSLFPKDFEMEKDMLAQQWIAHGFVKEKEGIDTQQSAKDCLNELVDRCLLEEGHADLDDRFLRMHDVIHDLALYIGDDEYSHDSVKTNTRHLSLTGKDQDSLSLDGLKFESNKLRTLLCHEGLPPKVVCDLKGLRVLRMEGFSDELSQSIDRLLHLKYLDLSYSHVKSMCTLHNLPFLKTLRLSSCDRIRRLPCLPKLEVMKLKGLCNLEGWSSTEDGKAVILPCLRELEIYWCKNIKWLPCLPKVEVMKLKSLQSLEGWSSTEDGKAVILPCLRTLSICECENIKRLPCIPKVEVMELRYLHSLEEWSSTEDGRAVILSCLRELEIYSCSNIKRLPCLPKVEVVMLVLLMSLEGWSSTEDGKTVILPCLRTLKISYCENIKRLPSLPKVEVMQLNELKSLEGWSSTEDGKAVILPCLRALKISRCKNFKRLPSLPKLDAMELKYLYSLEGWSSAEDGKAVIFPFLRTLSIYECENIKRLPCLPKVEAMELRHLRSLEGWSGADGKAVILSCLRELKIYWCENIKWLPQLLKVEVMVLNQLKGSEGWSSKEDGKRVILTCLRSLLINECPNIEALQHFPAVVQDVLDTRFIEAESDSECSLVCLNGNVEEKESFLLELFFESVSKSLDHACVEIGKTHEDVFQSLQAPHNLETLSLRNYLGKQLPSWFSMDANIGGRLKELNLSHCLMLKVLTIHLPVVERMSLEGLRSLEEWSAGDDERAATFPRLKSFKMDDCPNIKLLPFLPVVEELRLTRLPKCKGWPKPVEMPYLREPYVRDCPHLSCFPSSFNVVSQTRLDGDSNDCWSMIGVSNDSPSFPSSSVDNLELWFDNARQETISKFRGLVDTDWLMFKQLL